jgi:hypothetical protein
MDDRMKALVTGATGLIGKQLPRSIENPVVLSPEPRPSEARRLPGLMEAYLWESEMGPALSEALLVSRNPTGWSAATVGVMTWLQVSSSGEIAGAESASATLLVGGTGEEGEGQEVVFTT